jgi:hypothetical protein
MTIVYRYFYYAAPLCWRVTCSNRARCFADEAESKRFNAQVCGVLPVHVQVTWHMLMQWRDGSKQMPLDEILGKFAADLAGKGKVKSAQAAMDMNRCTHPSPPSLNCSNTFIYNL